MKTKLPNFICVGAQKAGTTSLHDILIQHPDIFLPEIKETKFFQKDYEKGLNFYIKKYFSNANDTQCVGEIDPDYLYFEECAEKIYTSLGSDVKIVIMLRNPLERAYSQYLMTKRRGCEELSFESAIEHESSRIVNTEKNTFFTQKHYFSYISRGLYAKQIKNYLQYFKRENLHIILFEEDFIANKEKTVQNILNFLGVKEDLNLNLNLKSNPATEPKSKILTKLIHKRSPYGKVIKILIPSITLRNKIKYFLNNINQKVMNKEPLSQDVKQKIYQHYFKNDIEQLEKLLNISLHNWKYGGVS